MKTFFLFVLISVFCSLHQLNAQCVPANTFVTYYDGLQTSAELEIYNATTGGTYYLEYGLAGFTPGTAGTAGPGGTLLAVNVIFPAGDGSVIVNGLTANTVYHVYQRKNCSGVWSNNSGARSFMTAIDCSTIPTLNCNTLITTLHPVAYGSWTTPACINGGGGSGAERIFSFTPSFTGMHKIYIAANSGVTDYVYKAASGGCSNANWLCIGTNNSGNNVAKQFSFGPLTAGIPYFIRADPGIYYSQQTSIFRIECPVLNCSEVTNVNAMNISTNSATIFWTGAGSCIVEIGPEDFIPGMGSTAGTNGTIVTLSANGSYNLSGLTPSTEYDVYVRKYCAVGSSSPNSNVFAFYTMPCPQITNYTTLGISTPMAWYGGTGVLNSQICMFGAPMPGDERILRFTSPSTGYFQLDVVNNLPPPAIYSLALTQNCTLNNLNCLNPYNTVSNLSSYALGPLTAGTTYDLLFDIDDTTHNIFNNTISARITCPKPSTVSASDFQPNSVKISWGCSFYTPCQSPPYLEYGPQGFTPGTGATAGTNGTLISGISAPYTITGLQPFTKYDVYLRTNCGGNFSTNTSVTTIRTSVDCSTASSVSCSDYLTFSVTGISNTDNGAWISNACGNTNYLAKESVWKFTPALSGTYSLYVYNLTAGSTSYTWPTSFYVKPESLGCNELNWTCAGTINQNLLTFVPATISLGNLTAGTTYLIMADGFQPTFTPGYTYFFRIECPGVCAKPLLGTTSTTNSTATINGSCVACTGITYVEYGLTGFTPGTDAAAGAGGTVISNVTFPVVLSGLTPATSYDVYARKDCGTPNGFSPNSIKKTVVPCFTAPASLTSNIPGNTICLGGSITLSQVGGVLPPGGVYKWYSGSCGATFEGTGSSITLSPLVSKSYRVIVETPCGNSGCTAALAVTVNAPAAVITPSGPVSFCPGGSVVLNASAATGNTYQWKLGGVDIPGATSISYTASATGNYTVAITNSSGCSNTSLATAVTVNAIPSVSFSGLAASYLNTDPAATLTGSPAGGTFSGPGISGNTFNPSVAGNGGPYTILYSYTDGNGCSNTSSQQTSVTGCTAAPAQPGTITTTGGSAPVCPGDTKTYSITPVAGATSYNWIPPAGGTITSGQGSVSVTINYTSGFTVADSLKVSSVNNCGTSLNRAVKIFRNSPSTPGNITGEAYGLCNKTGIVYTVPAISGITNNWSFNTINATVASGQGTNTITANFLPAFLTNAVLSVTASNGCGTSLVRNLTVRSLPANPSAITGSLAVCANQQGVPYSITPLFGVTNYTWVSPKKSHPSDGIVTSNNTTLITTASGITVNYGNSGGILKVRGNNACGSSAYSSINIAMNCRVAGEITLPAIPDVTIFPNPANNEINISISNYDEFEVQILNMLGEKMYLSQNESVINLSSFAPGIYMMQINCGEHIVMEKFIIE